RGKSDRNSAGFSESAFGRGDCEMRKVMNDRGSERIGTVGSRIKARRPHRAAMLLATAAAGLLGSARSARAAGVSLWMDQNGATASFGSGAVSWDTNITNDWNTNGTTGNTTAPGKWLQAGQSAGLDDFNIANFNAAFTATV